MEYLGSILSLAAFFFFFRTLFYQITFEPDRKTLRFRSWTGEKQLSASGLSEWGVRRMAAYGGWGG